MSRLQKVNQNTTREKYVHSKPIHNIIFDIFVLQSFVHFFNTVIIRLTYPTRRDLFLVSFFYQYLFSLYLIVELRLNEVKITTRKSRTKYKYRASHISDRSPYYLPSIYLWFSRIINIKIIKLSLKKSVRKTPFLIFQY